jgi:ABC-type bacteriocin/lantibiotic exporter with double-glycine peptidase domain
MQLRRVLEAVLPLVLGGAAIAAAPLNLWLDVPFVRQQKNLCGPASVAMVVEYWQQHQGGNEHAAPAAEIVRSLAPESAHGLRATAMLRYFRQHGYRAFAYAGGWNDLGHQIQQGRPLIAALHPEGDDDLHYVVVAGIDDPDRLILVNDPAQRKLLKEDRTQFEREWKATGNWTLLAVPAAAQH